MLRDVQTQASKIEKYIGVISESYDFIFRFQTFSLSYTTIMYNMLTQDRSEAGNEYRSK